MSSKLRCALGCGCKMSQHVVRVVARDWALQSVHWSMLAAVSMAKEWEMSARGWHGKIFCTHPYPIPTILIPSPTHTHHHRPRPHQQCPHRHPDETRRDVYIVSDSIFALTWRTVRPLTLNFLGWGDDSSRVYDMPNDVVFLVAVSVDSFVK